MFQLYHRKNHNQFESEPEIFEQLLRTCD